MMEELTMGYDRLIQSKARLGLWNVWAFTPFIVIGLAMIPRDQNCLGAGDSRALG